MNNQHLLSRSLGLNTSNNVLQTTTTRLIYALQATPITFSTKPPSPDNPNVAPPAHISGVNALTIDKFEGRYLLSGGADSSLAIWDLETPTSAPSNTHANNPSYLPLSFLSKTSKEHKLGITQVQFYPFDSLAFLTSSYDHTVKLYNSETLHCSASWDLDAVVYNIALSPIADHLLVACATQHSAVRLIDLRSGASTHSLAGHSGAVLSTAWSPVREHILASGATDGSVRFWDIRRGNGGELGVLDYEDSIGVLRKPFTTSNYTSPRNPADKKAHRGPVNGIVWTEDGHHIITCGHDERIRVWDTDTGANTLANFGPMVRNSGLAPCIPVLPPSNFLPLEKDVLFYPNGHEILGYELFEGQLMSRLRRPEKHQPLPHAHAGPGNSKGERNVRDKVMALAWRAHDVEMYSAHADGSIVAWKPRTEEDAELDEEEKREREERDVSKKRKRNALEEIYQELTKRKVTFGGL